MQTPMPRAGFIAAELLAAGVLTVLCKGVVATDQFAGKLCPTFGDMRLILSPLIVYIDVNMYRICICIIRFLHVGMNTFWTFDTFNCLRYCALHICSLSTVSYFCVCFRAL